MLRGEGCESDSRGFRMENLDVHFVLSVIENHWNLWGKVWCDQCSALGESMWQVCGWWNGWLQFVESLESSDRGLLHWSGHEVRKAWAESGGSVAKKENNGFSISSRKSPGERARRPFNWSNNNLEIKKSIYLLWPSCEVWAKTEL